MACWGTTYDLQLVAEILRQRGISNRIIVHTLGSNVYQQLTALSIHDSMLKVAPPDVIAGDIVVVNTGCHWAATRYDPEVTVGELAHGGIDTLVPANSAETAIVLDD